MKIVVLGGGVSRERWVSLQTSECVLEALRASGHKAIYLDSLVGIDAVSDDLFDAQDGLIQDLRRSISLSDKEIRARIDALGGAVIEPNVWEACRRSDFVFIALHGVCGEDGRLQGALDLMGIPYNGSGCLSSAMAMDKRITRRIMQQNGISVAPLVSEAPCVVKAAHGGSSIGVKICRTNEELDAAVSEIRALNDDYFLERILEGTEISVSVLNGRALEPIEFVYPKDNVFQYEAKYTTDESARTLYCPARLSEEQTEAAQRTALKLHQAMQMSGCSRTDMIIDRSGEVFGLEINALPGLTATSFFPFAARKSGISLQEMLKEILEAGLKRSADLKKRIAQF